MKTKYDYIHFIKVEQKPKTSVWSCRNRKMGEELGKVRWYPTWRIYCYFPYAGSVYSPGCLADIEDFMLKLRLDEVAK